MRACCLLLLICLGVIALMLAVHLPNKAVQAQPYLLGLSSSSSDTFAANYPDLFIDVPSGFDVNTISSSHPRLIDTAALYTKLQDSAYDNYVGVDSALDVLNAAADDGDPAACGLLYQMTSNTTRRDECITALNNISTYTADTDYWGVNLSEIWSAMIGYDMVYDDLTSQERTDVYEWVRDGFRRESDLTLDWTPGTSLSYVNNNIYDKPFYHPDTGTAQNWAILLTFAHDGHADTTISDIIDDIIADDANITTGDRYWFNPWEMINFALLCAGEFGGFQGGVTHHFGGSYYAYFTESTPLFFHCHDQATGENLSPKWAFTSECPRLYFYESNHYAPLGANGRRQIEYCTGMSDDDEADVARWLIQQEGRDVYNAVADMIVGDLRGSTKTFTQAGYSLNGWQTFTDYWASYEGYNVDSDSGDTRVRVINRHTDVMRIEPFEGCISIYRGSLPILVEVHRLFTAISPNVSSGMFFRDDTTEELLNQQYESLSDPPGGYNGATRVNRPDDALNDSRYYWGPPEYDQSGTGWNAVCVDATKAMVETEITQWRRTVCHLTTSDVVIIYDLVKADSGVDQCSHWKLYDDPTVNGDTDFTAGSSKFYPLAPSGLDIDWTGGLNTEEVDPFNTSTWIGGNKDGYTAGFSSNSDRRRRGGRGFVAIKPASYAATQEYVMVVDINDAHSAPTWDGSTVDVDGYEVTINSNGSVSVVTP